MKYVGLMFLTATLFACSPKKNKKEVEVKEYPILETMEYYQRFSQKLWLAGTKKNWELADFYTHELEEVTMNLIEGDVIHDDYNLSNLTTQMLLPKIEKVEEAIRLKNEVLFLENYKLMIGSCNLCHNTTKHNFIKILIPNDSTLWNQDFTAK